MMKGGIAGLMKQAQQMQANMEKAQAELAQTEVEGQSGAGAFHRLRAFWSRECLPREARSCARRLVEVFGAGCQNREKAGIIDGSLRRGARVAKGGRL